MAHRSRVELTGQIVYANTGAIRGERSIFRFPFHIGTIIHGELAIIKCPQHERILNQEHSGPFIVHAGKFGIVTETTGLSRIGVETGKIDSFGGINQTAGTNINMFYCVSFNFLICDD